MVKAQVGMRGGWQGATVRSSQPAPAPTEEQQAAIETFGQGKSMVLEALAGTGKTTSLRQISASTRQTGIYLAYNRSTADEAKASFPANIRPMTLHSLAYRAVVTESMKQRLNAPRQTNADVAKILSVPAGHAVDRARVLQGPQLARLTMEAISKFCFSADQEIGPQHVPAQIGVSTPEQVRDLARVIVPLARKAWWDLKDPDGQLKFQHDHYMKIYALRDPRLHADFVLVDEAQDSNDVVVGLINAQEDMQVVAVGDRRQQLYEWRGSIDALDSFNPQARLFLTQSFRFGPAIAERANRWLDILGSEVHLRGTESIRSTVGYIVQPTAVLCRTNALVLQTVIDAQLDNVPVAIAGGGKDVRALAEAAQQLMETGRTWHPDLCAFDSWGAVQEYVESDFGGEDLKTLVRLVDRYGSRAIVRAIDRCVEESQASLVASTVHKAKGREWSTVQISTDFEAPGEDEDGSLKPIVDAEAMTAYVAVTRAKTRLDDATLSWLDPHLQARR